MKLSLIIATLVVAVLAGCGNGSEPAVDAGLDTDVDRDADATEDADPDHDHDHDQEVDGDHPVDAEPDADHETDTDEDDEVYVPDSARAELIFSGPARVATPPTWNAHLPKLVGDERFYYVVHTHYPDDVTGRFAAILRRSFEGGTWVEVARVVYPHQPPGLVMDTGARMHMVFDCLRPPGSGPVTCFPGGAGTGELHSRFYHLVFSARDEAGAFRFDTYANRNEWTAESNGYLGIGVTGDGLTFWSFADTSWNRIVQHQDTGVGVGTIATLSVPGAYLLYPIMTASSTDPSTLVIYGGEFDPAGGTNAAYLASTAYVGRVVGGFRQLFRRAPPSPEPGTVNAYPSDLVFEPDGTLLALSYLPMPSGECTELLRFDGGLDTPPTVLPVGCVGTYSKLQVASSGVLYLLASGSGRAFRIGVSADRGMSWTWHEVPIEGLHETGDVSFFGMTPITAQSSPGVYDLDVLRFLFSGADDAGLARHTYLGEIDLR